MLMYIVILVIIAILLCQDKVKRLHVERFNGDPDALGQQVCYLGKDRCPAGLVDRGSVSLMYNASPGLNALKFGEPRLNFYGPWWTHTARLCCGDRKERNSTNTYSICGIGDPGAWGSPQNVGDKKVGNQGFGMDPNSLKDWAEEGITRFSDIGGTFTGGWPVRHPMICDNKTIDGQGCFFTSDANGNYAASKCPPGYAKRGHPMFWAQQDLKPIGWNTWWADAWFTTPTLCCPDYKNYCAGDQVVTAPCQDWGKRGGALFERYMKEYCLGEGDRIANPYCQQWGQRPENVNDFKPKFEEYCKKGQNLLKLECRNWFSNRNLYAEGTEDSVYRDWCKDNQESTWCRCFYPKFDKALAKVIPNLPQCFDPDCVGNRAYKPHDIRGTSCPDVCAQTIDTAAGDTEALNVLIDNPQFELTCGNQGIEDAKKVLETGKPIGKVPIPQPQPQPQGANEVDSTVYYLLGGMFVFMVVMIIVVVLLTRR